MKQPPLPRDRPASGQQAPALRLTEDVFSVVLVLQGHHVGELLLLVHQVQAVRDHRVVFEAVLADCEHHLDHVLDTFVDGRLVKDVPQTLKDGCG